jgi:general stress protein 26
MEPESKTKLPRATADEMQKIRELAADIEVTMLTTEGPNGSLRSRPMGTVLDSDTASVWLFVSADSETAKEIRRHPQVGLSFSDPERDRYISLSGQAEFVDEAAEIRRLWREEFARWFPGGPDDPELALVHVQIVQAEYWDDSGKLMRNFFETIGAPYSGVPAEAVGAHAKVKPR